jgi:hypothetical protein
MRSDGQDEHDQSDESGNGMDHKKGRESMSRRFGKIEGGIVVFGEELG